MKLSDEEIGGVLEDGAQPQAYMDPSLEKDDLQYSLFLLDLLLAGPIGFTDNPHVEFGAFFVTKKSARLRLVLDARPVKHVFSKPPATV